MDGVPTLSRVAQRRAIMEGTVYSRLVLHHTATTATARTLFESATPSKAASNVGDRASKCSSRRPCNGVPFLL